MPLFQSVFKCETILMKMTDLQGFAVRLVLKQRHKQPRSQGLALGPPSQGKDPGNEVEAQENPENGLMISGRSHCGTLTQCMLIL